MAAFLLKISDYTLKSGDAPHSKVMVTNRAGLRHMPIGHDLQAGDFRGPHPKQCGWGRDLSPCQVSSCSIQPFGYNIPTSQTDRTDRHDRIGQRSDGIGRTVLQTVAQKLQCFFTFY